ncbi:MAG: hypothetical protein RLY31_1696 [Bacteroidota bacterium]|jgi:uncharacterized membrane protein YbhN (UPF0104 family)
MKRALLNTLQFLLFLSIGFGILFLVFQHQEKAYLESCCLDLHPDWNNLTDASARQTLLDNCRLQWSAETSENCPALMQKLVDDFGKTRFGWLGLVLLAFLVSNISRAYKWRMLLSPLGYRPSFGNSFLSILVGYFANLGLPRMGEVVRGGLLSKYEDIPMQKVMGTIVTDRLVDILCLGLTFLVALLFEFNKISGFIQDAMSSASPEADMESGPSTLLGLSAAALSLLFLAMAYLHRQRIWNSKPARKIIDLLNGFWEGLQTIRRLEKPAYFLLHSLNIWFMFFLMTWLGFQAFDPTVHLGFRAALTVFVFGTLGFVIPSPGGMGTFHFLVISALTAFYDVRGDDAFSMANIIFFSVQIGFNALLGMAALLMLPILNKRNPAR